MLQAIVILGGESLSSVTTCSWQTTAAYVYVLLLEGASLAWEYLRRNPDYRRDWLAGARDPASAARWGLAALENPDLDARDAQPLWQTQARRLVRLVDESEPHPDGDRFSLWQLPGRKRLLHDGVHLTLTLAFAREVAQVGLGSMVEEGGAIAFLVPAVEGARHWRTAQRFSLLLRRRGPAKDPGLSTRRVACSAILHMRSLQALDGHASGASHRDIAAAIFSEKRAARSWHADSDLRARVRHLLCRADRFVRGGYRTLVARGTA